MNQQLKDLMIVDVYTRPVHTRKSREREGDKGYLVFASRLLVF